MKKFLFATFMGALVALVGCQQDDELTGVENTLGKKVSVTANIKANAQSRVALDYVIGEDGGSTIKVDWKESGESFLMYDANDSSKKTIFTQTSGYQFEGELPSESGPYYAVYGDDANLANQDGTLNENYVWMGTDLITDLTQSIEFNHLTTILNPTFKFESESINASITKIVIPGDAQAITITPSQATDMFIFLPVMNGEAIGEGTPFNFIVTADGKDYVAELSISQSMNAGEFYTADIHLEEIPYVTFTADADQTLKYTGNDLQYSLDGTTFVDLEANTEIEFSEDGKLYLRNKGEENLDGTKDGDIDCSISFTTEAHVACEGDIRTLINYATYKTVDTSNATFASLFKNCVQLRSAPALQATTLEDRCYESMFSGCTSLENAPALPATTLEDRCYESMFSGCTSLVNAPALPATTLAYGCYSSMFSGCTSLVNAPALPATTLAGLCYIGMFKGCTKLETAPELPATTLVQQCYGSMFYGCEKLNKITMLATDISANWCLEEWVVGVAAEGTFTKAPTMTTLLENSTSGIPAGWTVKDKL